MHDVSDRKVGRSATKKQENVREFLSAWGMPTIQILFADVLYAVDCTKYVVCVRECILCACILCAVCCCK